MKKILSFFLFASLSTFAQSTKSDNDLHSSGDLPSSVVNELQVKIKAECGEEDRMSYTRKLGMDSVIWYDTYLYNLLLSGEVLYGDSLGMYVNRVAGQFLKNGSDNAGPVHFYVVRSSFPEIYSFKKGFVFVTTGLIAQLENEAQLAFILAHEVAHIKLKHTDDLNIRDGTELYYRNQFSYVGLMQSLKRTRSIKEETEADAEALRMLKDPGYSSEAGVLALELFFYRSLPFDDKPFDPSIFNFPNFKLRDPVLLKKTEPIKPRESGDSNEEGEDLLRQRRGNLESEALAAESGQKKFILPKQDFLAARNLARFALCRDYIADRDYVNAIYASSLLLKKYPGDHYLETIISQGLYAAEISRSSDRRGPLLDYTGVPKANQSEYDDYIDFDYTRIEGNSQAVYYLFGTIEPQELNVMSILYTWKSYKSSGDRSMKPIIDSLLEELFTANHLLQSSFAKHTKEEQRALDSIAGADNSTEENKYSRIKAQQTSSSSETTEAKLAYAFIDQFKDDEFTAMYNQAYIRSKNRSHTGTAYLFLGDKKKPVPLAVIVDPTFSIYPSKKELIKSESEKIEQQREIYIKMLATEIKKKSLPHIILRPTDSLGLSADEYNDRAKLHRWFLEREKNGNNPDPIVFGAGDMQALADKYGTPFFAFCVVRVVDQANDRTDHVFKVYNVVTGELVRFEVKFINYLSKPADMLYHINDCLEQLSTPASK
ncbi:MAG: M48 family metallopeptidase [Bacteroidia bacterium]